MINKLTIVLINTKSGTSSVAIIEDNKQLFFDRIYQYLSQCASHTDPEMMLAVITLINDMETCSHVITPSFGLKLYIYNGNSHTELCSDQKNLRYVKIPHQKLWVYSRSGLFDHYWELFKKENS